MTLGELKDFLKKNYGDLYEDEQMVGICSHCGHEAPIDSFSIGYRFKQCQLTFRIGKKK